MNDSNAIIHQPSQILNNNDKGLVNKTNYGLRRASEQGFGLNSGDIPHITFEAVERLAEAARARRAASASKYRSKWQNRRAELAEHRGERDALLIMTLFDACLRISESLNLHPKDLKQTDTGWTVTVLGKGNKWRTVSISDSIAALLQAYAYKTGIKPIDRLFPITRGAAWAMIRSAYEATGVMKPEQTGHVHVIRHSGALARLEDNGHPKSLQDQLGHSSIGMTMRYLKTLEKKQSVAIQHKTQFQWKLRQPNG